MFYYWQTAALQKVASIKTWWWIKADGCDVVKGTWESTTGKWSGDVDLNNGKLEQLYKNYQEQVRFTESVGLTSRSTPGQVKQDLATILKSIDLDLKFLKESRRANDYKHHKFINFYV